MNPHVLLVSIGPVQQFIAAARRCQDLWYGSYLLSELSEAAAHGVSEVAGRNAVLFPSFEEDQLAPEQRQAAANKILAVLPRGCSPQEAAERGRACMQQRLEEIMSAAFDRVQGSRWDRPMAEAQVRQLIEYIWVAVEQQGPDDYARAHQQAERVLSWRKNTRLFSQPSWPQPPGQPKSSLDGVRESVLDEQLFDEVRQGTLSAAELRRQYHVAPGERLCGVGLLRRLGAEDDGRRPPFHSAGHIASAPVRTRLHVRGEEGARALRRYLDVLADECEVDLERFRIRSGQRQKAEVMHPFERGERGERAQRRYLPRVLLPEPGQDNETWGLDGSLLLPGQLLEVLEEGSPRGWEPRVQVRAQEALDKLLRELGLKRPPCAYYVLLQADGDQMGRLISQLRTEEQHRRLSRALRGFARGEQSDRRSALRIVEKHGGSPVYVGGDDVLALLPLHTALDCAEELQAFFASSLRPLYEEAGLPGTPTLSVGLAIAHHQESLGEVRHLARQAEQLAKQRRGSLALAMSKRSGDTLMLAARWEEHLPSRLYRWCQLLARRELPAGVAFELEAAARPLLLHAKPGEQDEVARALARRILARKRRGGGEDTIDPEVARMVNDALEGHLAVQTEPRCLVRALLSLSVELQMARLFLTALDDAWEVMT